MPYENHPNKVPQQIIYVIIVIVIMGLIVLIEAPKEAAMKNKLRLVVKQGSFEYENTDDLYFDLKTLNPPIYFVYDIATGECVAKGNHK